MARRLTVDERHEAAAKYMPTQEQIAAECELIRATWSDCERLRRSGIRKSDGDEWCMPAVRCDPEADD